MARQQLLGLGFTGRAIDHRLERGRLHPALRGIYTIGRPEMSQRGRWMAAVLACGEEAMLSHRSAAALWNVGRELRGRIDVSVRRRCELRHPGLNARGRPVLRRDDLVNKDGIPVTAIARTLVDLATELDEIAIERAVNEADKYDLISPDALRAAIDRYKGEPGAPLLRRILDKRTFLLSDSDLEILFPPDCRRGGAPAALQQTGRQRLEGRSLLARSGPRRRDRWPALPRTTSTQTRDVRRDRAHALAGMTALRFTHYEVKHEPAAVRNELRQAHALLRERIRH